MLNRGLNSPFLAMMSTGVASGVAWVKKVPIFCPSTIFRMELCLFRKMLVSTFDSIKIPALVHPYLLLGRERPKYPKTLKFEGPRPRVPKT